MNKPTDYTIPPLDFSYAHGEPSARADFRSTPEDFVVREELGVEPDGAGEHLLLHLSKRGENTGWVAQQLAAAFGIREMDVGYCGMKDRHALTSQWFSLYLPSSPEADAATLQQFFATHDSLTLLASDRHSKKLRRGQHRCNRFSLTLRAISDTDSIIQRLERVSREGVPNYFGEQRFGRQSSNLYWARRWFEGGEQIRNRGKKVMAKSAARAYLFNLVLSQRVAEGSWKQLICSDPESLTGPLWGRGRPKVSESLAAWEAEVLTPYGEWLQGLEHVGLQQERRVLALQPADLHWQLTENTLTVSFSLPPGTFATAVLREIAHLNNISSTEESG